MEPNRDATDERKRRREDGGEDGGSGETGSFDLINERTDWQILFDQPHLWQQNLEVAVEDITALRFLGINLKTDPSLLRVRAELSDGTVYPDAFLSIPRAFGLQMKSLRRLAQIPLKSLTHGKSIWLTVPKSKQTLQEEITRVTNVEKSFSRTVKRYFSHRTWLQRLGIQDPVSHRLNNEILGIYAIVFAVFGLFVFGLFYLME